MKITIEDLEKYGADQGTYLYKWTSPWNDKDYIETSPEWWQKTFKDTYDISDSYKCFSDLLEIATTLPEATKELLFCVKNCVNVMPKGGGGAMMHHVAWDSSHGQTWKPRFNTLENKLEIIQMLLDHGADINLKDDHGRTPLFYAAWCGRYEVAKFLIKNGAAVNNTGECSVLHLAAEQGNLKMVKLFLKNGALLSKNKFGETPSDWATHNKHKALGAYLSKIYKTQQKMLTQIYSA